MKVLFVIDKKTPFESIQTLQGTIRDSLTGSVELTLRDAGTQSVEEYETLIQSHDAIIGTDANLFLARKDTNSSCPILVPSYGMATRGLLQIWEWREWLGRGDTFICSSTADLIGVAKHLKDDQIRLAFAPFALADSYFDNTKDAKDPAEVLSNFGIDASSHASWLLCVGRLNQQKNVHLTIRVMQALRDMNRSVGLLIAGKEDASGFPELGWDNKGYEQYLKTLVDELHLQEHVHFLGKVSQESMQDLYRMVDVHLTCSTFRTEDFGLAPVEAMAHGVPTVGTSWGGFWDTIQHELTGYRVPVYLTSSGFRVDWMAAAHRVDQILSDPSFQGYFERNCRLYAQANFTQAIFRERLLDAITRVSRERGDGFRPINLDSLVDAETSAFFSDLESRINTLGSLFEARKGLYEVGNGARIRVFFSEYVRSQPVMWRKDTIVYIPLPVRVDGNAVTTLDRNWRGTVQLADQEMKLVSELQQGGRTLSELSSATSKPLSEVIESCEAMMGKGIIIPLDPSVVQGVH